MSRALLSLAGFEVTLIGRFWVTAEDLENCNRPIAFFYSNYAAPINPMGEDMQFSD
jgi:hypothetical protein